MTDERLLEAARNNAEWCDTVCRSHGSAGTFSALSWTNPGAPPHRRPHSTSSRVGFVSTSTVSDPTPRSLNPLDVATQTTGPSKSRPSLR